MNYLEVNVEASDVTFVSPSARPLLTVTDVIHAEGTCSVNAVYGV